MTRVLQMFDNFFFFQAEDGIRDLIVTGVQTCALPISFGKSYKAAYYPKFSVSWVVSDEPFFARLPFVSPLKLRSAWGKAGQQPDAFAALRSEERRVGKECRSRWSPYH